MRPHESSLATRTSTQLLDALREPGNEPVWEQLDRRYRAVIESLATRFGLPGEDAREIAQQTLAEFARAYRAGKYERGKGRLSSWMLGIAKNHMLSLKRERAAHGAAPLFDDQALTDASSLRRIWGEERDRDILMCAFESLRAESSMEDRTLRAFELVALRGVPASEAGRQCGMTPDQVYVARSRVTSRLREVVRRLTDAFEDDV